MGEKWGIKHPQSMVNRFVPRYLDHKRHLGATQDFLTNATVKCGDVLWVWL